MLHGQDRQLEADHPPDLAGPQAAGVDDVLGVDRVAALDLDVPGAVRTLRQPDDGRVPMDLGAGHLGALRVGAGDAGRIDVPLDRVVQRPDEVLRIQQREEVLRFLGRDEIEVHPEVAAARDGHPQEVHPDLRVGQHQAARQVDGARLAADALDLLVQLDRVLLESGDVGVAVERVHPAGGVPGGAGRQVTALQQHDVGPAGLRQVVQDAGADHATTDDDALGLSLHGDSSTANSAGPGNLQVPPPTDQVWNGSRTSRKSKRRNPLSRVYRIRTPFSRINVARCVSGTASPRVEAPPDPR